MENDDTKETWGKKRTIREYRVRNCSDVSFRDHSSSGLKYHGLNFQRNVARKSEFSAIATKLEAICFFVLEEQWMNN